MSAKGAGEGQKGAKMTEPKILSVHKVYGLTVTRFRTRFGDVVWMVSDDAQVGHGGLFQGDRRGAVEVLRGEAEAQVEAELARKMRERV